MNGYTRIIKFLYPSAACPFDWYFSEGILEFWNESKLGPKPTIAFLESKRAEAEAFFAAQEAVKAEEQSKAELLKHIDYLTRLVLELKAREEARGGAKLEAVPVDLSTKLASLEVDIG